MRSCCASPSEHPELELLIVYLEGATKVAEMPFVEEADNTPQTEENRLMDEEGLLLLNDPLLTLLARVMPAKPEEDE